MSVDLQSSGLAPEFLLFGEDASRVVVSCDHGNLNGIKEVAGKYGISAALVGATTAERVEIKLDGQTLVSASISGLRDSYEQALEAALKADAELVTMS
jgi:phosphoribosylformylglycinamidine (FGAM) synthase-like enzyme